ncbi:peptidoglycan-binding domain-containing protein [Streptomyces sp. Li-HN-5-11]|uniref:peptidoglycan-binding domain-containing protein n=1 Tax=Streptomyces sp. Li-HN-5-11 TaxID=3075432 RepID=UPI0028A6E1B9|nr:peptidoglycan-binding domain-containing protein [Streptomyces sp. Li-HN-5-11]WNM33017.1 peptidoglycan-binding domain-containing protein [Streptomyces sp. Li-HN-5-11]
MSTPPGLGQPHGGPPIEPVRVIRPRRTDALAELMREFQQNVGAAGQENVVAPGLPEGPEEPATEELPPVGPLPSAPAHRPGSRRGQVRETAAPGRGLRRAAVAVAVAAAALVGFAGALLLPGRGEASTAAAPHPSASGSASAPAATPSAPPTATAAADPDGTGTLREGDSGPAVTELQQRLLRVPDVYRDGSTNGRYDSALKAAVARFQLWYGIRGDETGVYGDDTRRSLESRTALDGG